MNRAMFARKWMVGLFLAFLSISPALVANSASAATDVTVTWDANTEQDLAGYKLRWRVLGTETYTETDVGLVTTFRLEGLPDYVRVEISGAAYDTLGQQSEWSVPVTTPAVPQTMGRLKVVKIELMR